MWIASLVEEPLSTNMEWKKSMFPIIKLHLVHLIFVSFSFGDLVMASEGTMGQQSVSKVWGEMAVTY